MTAPARPEPLADFEQELLRFLPDVARYARSLAQSKFDADDLVQETFLNAWRARHTFVAGSDARRWLFAICRNDFIRRYRKGHREVSLDDEPELDALACAKMHSRAIAEGTAQIIETADVGPAIVSALAALPEIFREVVALVDVGGADYAEAAGALGIPVGTVRSRLFRARRILQEALIEHARDLGLRPRVPQEAR